MRQLDIVAVGNAMLDEFLSVKEENMHASVKEETQQICFRYGQKIHLGGFQLLAGGNACNVAVGLGRQGYTAGFCAEVGDDLFSTYLSQLLAKEPIDTALLLKTPGAKCSLGIGIHYRAERTMFVYHEERAHDFHFDNVETKWFYLTSLGNKWEQAYQRVGSYVKAKGSKLAFSPGTHQMASGLSSLTDIIRISEILFLNKDEGRQLLGIESADVPTEEILKRLRELGPKIVSVTDGDKGSFVLAKDGRIEKQESLQVEVIEKTGAGDAYASGFLGGYMQGKSVKECMLAGAVNASSVIGKIGAQAGLLGKEEFKKEALEKRSNS